MAKAAALLLLAGVSASHAAVFFEEKFDSGACTRLLRAAPRRAEGIGRRARREPTRTAPVRAPAPLQRCSRPHSRAGGSRFDSLLPALICGPLRSARARSGVGQEVGEEQLEEV